jgi:hypothetical protein
VEFSTRLQTAAAAVDGLLVSKAFNREEHLLVAIVKEGWEFRDGSPSDLSISSAPLP